jgi:hypothetical protein
LCIGICSILTILSLVLTLIPIVLLFSVLITLPTPIIIVSIVCLSHDVYPCCHGSVTLLVCHVSVVEFLQGWKRSDYRRAIQLMVSDWVVGQPQDFEIGEVGNVHELGERSHLVTSKVELSQRGALGKVPSVGGWVDGWVVRVDVGRVDEWTVHLVKCLRWVGGSVGG